ATSFEFGSKRSSRSTATLRSSPHLFPLQRETVSQLTRAGQKKNSFEKQKHNSIQQRYAKVGGKERGSDGVPIRESRAVRAVTGEYRRLREPGRSSTGL